jgi:hypothetical protein
VSARPLLLLTLLLLLPLLTGVTEVSSTRCVVLTRLSATK